MNSYYPFRRALKRHKIPVAIALSVASMLFAVTFPYTAVYGSVAAISLIILTWCFCKFIDAT
jgi:hypothetical protein